MDIKSIFDKFEEIGVCTFSTIDNGYPESRVAHFIAYDKEGLYFMTMNCKPFYRQLTETGKVSVTGLKASTQVKMTSDRNLVFEPGYFIRVTGDVREVSVNEIKAKNNPIFTYGLEDIERYPNMVFFLIYRAKGEIYDYDFDKIHRGHKLERKRFSIGNFPFNKPGFSISQKCIGCGACFKVCSFDAILKDPQNGKMRISGDRCDECGNCYNVCPYGAIHLPQGLQRSVTVR